MIVSRPSSSFVRSRAGLFYKLSDHVQATTIKYIFLQCVVPRNDDKQIKISLNAVTWLVPSRFKKT